MQWHEYKQSLITLKHLHKMPLRIRLDTNIDVCSTSKVYFMQCMQIGIFGSTHHPIYQLCICYKPNDFAEGIQCCQTLHGLLFWQSYTLSVWWKTGNLNVTSCLMAHWCTKWISLRAEESKTQPQLTIEYPGQRNKVPNVTILLS